MKKHLLLITLLLLGYICHAQQYCHFPDSNTMWTELLWPPDDLIHPWKPSFHCYGLLNKDTIIKSKKYHKLFKSNDTIFDESEYCGGIREDSIGRVYYFGDVTDCFGNINDYFKNREVLLFNFSVKVGDTLRNKYKDTISDKYNLDSHGEDWIIVESIDSIYLSGKFRKRINFENGSNRWVEGIGNITRGLFFTPGAVPNNGVMNRLVCLKQSDIWIYHFSYYPDCFPYYLNNIKETKKNKNDVLVFPNPVTDISYLKFNNITHQYEVLEIINVTGSKVKLCQINKLNTYMINKNDFSKGIYLIRLISKDGYTLKGKFIIE